MQYVFAVNEAASPSLNLPIRRAGNNAVSFFEHSHDMEECRRQMMSLLFLASAVVAIGGDYSGETDDDDDAVVAYCFFSC